MMNTTRAILTVALTVVFVDFTAAFAAAHEHQKVAPAKAKTVKPYPLETCLVSKEKLGSMGKPMVFVHKGQEMRLCCRGCLKEFKKDTAKFAKTLAEATKSKQAHSAHEGHNH